MPLVSKIYSFVSNFILSMILPSTEKGLGSYIFGHFFQKILEGLANFFYFICRWFLAFMDFLQYFIQKLIGLDYWLDSGKDGARKLSEATSEDMIFKFLYADSVQKVFRALIAVFVVLLIIFTIYAIIKSEWDYMTGDGSKGNSKASIFRSSAKAIALVIVFPILLVMGIVSSNAILASIVKAVGVDMSDTFGGKIFSVSAQSANKYRHYVDNNTYYPTSDKVTFYLDDAHRQICFGDGIDDETHVYYSNYNSTDGYLATIKNARKITIDSIFDPLVPKNISNFNGFCFRVKDKDDKKQYYFVMASSDKAESIYYYLKCVLGAEILTKNASWASDDVGKELLKNLESNFSALYDGTYLSSVNIHQGSETVRTVCRNSWNYSLIYVNPGISLSQSVSSFGTQALNTFDLGAANYSGAIMYNSQSVASYFDGGQFGNVQSKAEYSVMADVVDYMCDNNLTFYIMDATSPLIDWNYKYKDASNNDVSYCVDTKWISSNLSSKIGDPAKSSYNIATNQVSNVATTLKDDSKVLTFLTKYAGNYTLPAESDNDIIYTAKFNTGDELAGSRYIVCLKGSEYFYPLVNGKDFRIDNKNYCFKSVYYASEYKGVVWAKGTFDTNTVDARYGNPTYLKNTSSVDNGKDSIVTDTDGGYYYDFEESGDDLILKTYDYNTRLVYNSALNNYLATYNNGSLYAEGEKALTIKTTANNADDKDVTSINVSSVSELQNSKLVLKISSPFSSEYVLKWTGITETVGGTKYYQFASAEKGFCYVVYVSETSNYLKTKEVNGVLQVDTSKTYNSNSSNNKLYPCYLNGSASKEAKNLVLKSYTIKDYKIGDEAKSILKNTFSIFENTDDFYGTFTKSVLEQLNNPFDALGSTKYFDSNWGTRYYYIQNEGKMTPRPAFATADDSETAEGIFNNTLKVKLKSAEARMLEFYENAQTSDSVSCYRYQIENYSRNTFGCYLLEINIYLWKGIFEFKTGVVQQVSDTPVVSSTFKYSGNVSGITFDYFFDQNIKLQTFYAASGINYVLLLVASVLIIKVLFSALWGVIKRFYMITLYYLAMPVAASTMPIDDGKRFGDLREKIMGEVLSTYGVLIGLNVFFVLLAPIREISSTIFTEEAIANSGSYFLKKLPITANMLNELIYILFLLVAFTLINELPGFVQGLVGKGQSLDKTGAAVKGSVKSTMKSATDMISGKSLKSGFKEAVSMAPGVIPGSQFIIDGAKKVVGAVKKGGEKFKEGVESTAGAAAGANGGGGGPSGGPAGGPAGGKPAGNSRDNGKDESEEKKDGQTDEKTKSPLDEKPEGQYSDNAILKNVIENGDETKLNKQFFENGKITTANGKTLENLEIKNGKIMQDGKELKGDDLKAVRNAMAGKLTSAQRNSAAGKIAKRNALLGLGAKALAGVAAAVSLAIPGVGPGIALAIAGGSFLAKKGVGLVKKYRAADDQTKAQYIKKWGGNALKVGAGFVFGGGVLGAAAVGGVLFATNKLKARKANRGQLQISQMNPAMRQPLTATAGSTATGTAVGNATQTVASAYSDNAILKNVIENGDETKLNKQFFENGKITTANGKTLENLEIKNGKIMQDGKELKGDDLKAVRNAMAGKLTSAQRNSAAGKIAIKKAKNSIIAKGLIGAAAGIAMLIPGAGVLAAGGILAGSFLVKKSAGAIKRYRAANDQTKAQMIRRFGGRVMKVAAGAGIAAFTVGTLGMGGVGLAAGLGAAGIGGVMFARNRRRVRRSSAGQLQISERNPSFAQPFTAPSGTTATGAAQAEVYQAGLKNVGVSEYSNNEILKNVIKNGDEAKLNEQFFENGKITTADGKTLENLEIKNGKIMQDGKELKGDDLTAVRNAMAGKLTSAQRNAAAGKIAIKKAKNSIIAKGLIGAAAGTAMLIPGAGVLAAGGILAGSFLAKKGVGLVKKYRATDDQTKAQYIKKWGGNALKVVAGVGAAALTIGTFGMGGVGLAAGLGAAGIGGALYVKNRKVRVAGARVGGQSYAGNQQVGGYQSYSAAPTGPSVGQIVSTEQTQQIINNAQLPANIKQMIDEAVANGLMLEGANRMAVAAQIANNQAISDSNFVTNTNDAYRNAVANLSGTTGGRVIAADVLSSFATAMGTNNLDAANYLISDEQKIAIYKSMMTSEQLDTFNQKLEENVNMSIKDQLRLIENSTDRNGLGLNLGISIGAKGLDFTVNDMSVRGKGAKDDSVNVAIAQLLSHQDISSDSVVDSIVRTGYKNNTTRAIAGNYALTLNYQNETTGNITGSDYHQTVFDRAQNNADINAEAIYLYLQNNPEKLKEFKSQYRITDDTKDDVILESIKQGVKDSNSMLGQIKTQDYAKELSAVTAKYVGNGSFKVQAFDLLSKAQQMDYSAHLSANIAAISTGNLYGRTEQEQITERQLSEASFGDKELVSAFMNSSTENKDEIVNKIVAKYFNILGENGNVDINSDEAKKLIAEINSNPNSENGRLFTDLTQKALYNPEEVLVAYAKAKILGKTQEFSSASIRNNTADTVVVEFIMKNTPTDLVNEISQQEKDNFAKYFKLQTQSFRSQSAFSEANFELSKLEVVLEGKTLSAKEKEKLEQAKAGVAQLELRAKSDSEKVGQAFVSLGIANNKAYIAREQQLLSELQSKVLSKDSASLEFNTELDKFINGNTEHQMFINRMFSDAGMNISQVKKTSPQYISEKLGELANRCLQELDSRTSALSQTTSKSLSNEEFIKTIMQNSNEQEKDVITNQLVLDAVGINHENGKVNTDSVGYTAVIDEIISNEQNKAWQDKIQNIDWSSDEAVSVVVGYSKAKILGKQTDKNIDAYISGGEKGKQVNERVLENITKLGSVKSKSPEVQSIVEDYEAYGNLTDEDAQELIGAKSKQTEMYNQVKESFGYKEGGDKATNVAAEKAMKVYIDSNGQNKEILNSAGIKVDSKLLDAVNKKYFTFDETGKTQAENINITAALAEEESSKVQRLEALQKANKTKASLEKQLQTMGYTSGVQIGGVTNTTAERAIDNLKAQYLSGERDISKLNSTAQGFTNASQVAEFLRQTVPTEQLAELKQETSQNGFATLSIAEQNALLAKLATQDTGATRILKNNNVDVNSMDLISRFLNSPAGEALKERLISEITETLFAMNAAKLGLSDSQAYSLLQKQTTTKQSAEVYEQQQGMLISNERVKKELEQTSHSDNAEKVISTAAGKVQLLTEAEKQQAIVEGIYNYLSSKAKDQIQSVEKSGVGKEAKTEVERKQQVISSFKENNRELYREAESMTYAQAIAIANRNMIANGGLERQRSVASLIWNNDEFKGKAGALYKAENHGSELDNISEIDRNNWLFNNYSRFISSGSDILKEINKKITDMPVDFRTQASNRKVLNNLNQTEFDNIIREMKTDGEKIVSTAKQNIIAKENINGKLTEIPDVSKMSKQEAGEYSANKSMLQQYYRHNENSEEFANLFRNVTLINDSESIRQILSNNNPNASEKEIFDARVQALKNNAEFTGRAMVSVLSSAQNKETFTKIKDYLKSNGIDFERLSNTEKSQRIREVLKDEKFVKENKIDTAKLNDLFEKKIISNSSTATNYDVKMGLTQAQISAFLRSGQGEPVRERLIEVGAHRPEHMFDRRRYRQARANHVINNPVMKKIFVNTMMREFYTDAEFKKLIQRELLNQDSNLFEERFKKMTREQVNKYINDHIDELREKLGTNELLKKNKAGKFEFADMANFANYSRTIDNLEYQNPTFAGKMKDSLKGVLKKMMGVKTDKNADVDDLMRDLTSKLENDEKLQSVIKNITKTTIKQQFNNFLNGDDVRVLVETNVDKRLNDPVIANRIYSNHNAALASKISRLESQIASLRRDYAASKKKK